MPRLVVKASMNSEYENGVIRQFVAFGNRTDAVRAILLTSSLCNPDAPSDILSDFDIELFFDDPMPFVECDDWIETIGLGRVMALWHWPNEWDHEEGDAHHWMRMTYFEDGTKADITLGQVDDLRAVSEAEELPQHYDIGYKVLLDKDGITASMKPPKYEAYILQPPTAAQYASRVETFWMNSTYVARYLWREDIIGAKWRLHELFDRGLREVVEWSCAMDREWRWRPGNLGRGLTKSLDPATSRELISTFAGGDIDDLWESLFRMTALYRKTAIKVGERLGFAYPHDLDRRVTAYHSAVRSLDKYTGSREELARLLKGTG